MRNNHAAVHESTLKLKKISEDTSKRYAEGSLQRGSLYTPTGYEEEGKLFTKDDAKILGMTKLVRTEEDAKQNNYY